MNILVLNGSPKGLTSVTMQYVHYLQKKLGGHDFKIENISQHINRLERDSSAFAAVLDKVAGAEAVLWAFPVYYFVVPSQYKRFIELVSEGDGRAAFAGKYAASLSTSIHILDHTAHNYVHAVAEDLGMNFFGSFSADMEDLFKKEERRNLLRFGRAFLEAAEKKAPVARVFEQLPKKAEAYSPKHPETLVDPGKLKILLLTDQEEDDNNLAALTARFTEAFSGGIRTVNIRELAIKSGCVGCIKCGWDNSCRFDKSDDFRRFYDEAVKGADVLVLAGKMRDRYLSARWKAWFDRSFYNGHCPSLTGKQLAFLIEGPLRQNSNLRQVLESYTRMMEANLAGIVTDEDGSAAIDLLVDSLAARIVENAQSGYMAPPTFIPVGVMNIFRNEIGGRLRFVFEADHHFYKKRGFYRVPQKTARTKLVNAAMLSLLKIPALRKQVYSTIPKEMIRPYSPILALADKEDLEGAGGGSLAARIISGIFDRM